MRSTGFKINFVDFKGTQIVLLNATSLGYASKEKVVENPWLNSFFSL